jgi:hypothetical protein
MRCEVLKVIIIMLKSSWVWCRVVLQVVANVLEKHDVFIFRAEVIKQGSRGHIQNLRSKG